MGRTNRVVALGAVAVVAGVFLSLVGPSAGNVPAAKAATLSTLERYAVQATAADGSAYEYIPVGNKGWTAVGRKGDRSTVTWPMYSLATGEVIGTFTNDFKTKGPGTVDAMTTFAFADGKLVSNVQVSFVPDPARPDWILVGARPDADSVVEATGVFAGRTGRVDMSGTNDLSKFATDELYQDAFWIIKLNK
jgi:hypothetical protein